MKIVPQKLIQDFVNLANRPGSCEYNDENKRKFHRWGKRILALVAEKMGLAPGTYDIRNNVGGVAVSGEIMLHGEKIYIQLAQSCVGSGTEFMFRSCNGRRDYTGKRNHWMKFSELLNIDKAVITFKAVADGILFWVT